MSGQTPRKSKLSELVGNVLRLQYYMLDDAEEIEGGFLQCDEDDWKKLHAACEEIEERLPAQPGYVSQYTNNVTYAIRQLETDLSEAVAALKERDKLWCAAIIATQEAPGREPLTCDVQKLLAYFNSHKPPVQ